MSFIWNGVSSDTMKFNVTSRQVYNAPAFDLNAVEVPGRSGDLLNPQNRFKNKQVTYTGFLKASDFEGSTWREKLSTGLIQLKGWLCSDAGQYHELTDDYDPGFTRYGYISGETAISDIEDRPFGVTLTVTFNVKPYMYTAGEPMELPETKSDSGDIITITDGADNTPLKSAVVNIEPVQSGSGDPSPTNIRPISGWSEVKGWHSGKNILSNSMAEVGTAWNGTSNSARARLVVQCKPSTKYTLSMNGTSSMSNIFRQDSAVVPASSVGGDITNLMPYTFTTGASSKYIIIAFSKTGITQGDVDALKLQLEEGSAATAYESTAVPINFSLGQTVYGGTLDVVRGKLVIDQVKVTLDGTQTISLANWRPTATGVGWLYSQSALGNKVYISDQAVPKIVSNKLKTVKYATAFGATQDDIVSSVAQANGISSYGLAVRISDTSLTTTAAINAYLAANPIDVVYELATPIEVDLTPQTIKTLLGVNNIWADAGSMEIEYPVPTENPYPFGSRPLYEITMDGTGTLAVNGKEWTITDYTGTLYCDTEAMEWYDASQLRNNIVSGDGWPVFEAGENSVSYTGDITKVMVTPRWRTL